MNTQTKNKGRVWFVLLPVVLTAGLVAFILSAGPAGIFPGNFPPVEELTVTRSSLHAGEITLDVANGGPSPVTIAQVLVDEAYWAFSIEPAPTIERLGSATVTIPYPWVEGEPVEVTLITSTGLTFGHAIDVATETPTPGRDLLLTFALLGIYIGVLPVGFGMAAKPFLQTLSRRWLAFFMALTAGVLIFLAVETLDEALESAQALPAALGGLGVVTLGSVGAFALILAGSRWLQRRTGADRRLVVAYAVAAGIGLHNLGEGLAVGSAYRLGEIALGAFLVVGFAIHNTTEGIGIVSLLGDRKTTFRHLLALGAIAGVPTILGGWTGAFVFSPTIATVFLAIAAGAIAQVVVDVMLVVKEESPDGLVSFESLGGIAFGLAIMYATSLLVAA